ncbi:MAG: hypothetical protein QNJ45_08255 [Ardenticatenaceae bacterium]|nr:hypothetical protein [Ardenticatenaceae bacterium]
MLKTLRSWHRIRNNPIYRRENGYWGEPNHYYREINRYMPFVVLGVMVIGFCCGANTLSTMFGLSTNESALTLAACLPNFVVQMISWAAIVLVPALTAPMVVEEVRLGTWEMLRLTPFSTEEILISKLLGGLLRLKIWRILLLLNAFQLLAAVAALLIAATIDTLGIDLLVTLVNPVLILRPWVEIIWVALTGLVLSTWMATGRAALVATYGITIGVKLLNGWLLWAIVASISELAFSNTTLFSLILTLGPFLGYVVLLIGTYWVLIRRARYLDENVMVPAG